MSSPPGKGNPTGTKKDAPKSAQAGTTPPTAAGTTGTGTGTGPPPAPEKLTATGKPGTAPLAVPGPSGTTAPPDLPKPKLAVPGTGTSGVASAGPKKSSGPSSGKPGALAHVSAKPTKSTILVPWEKQKKPSINKLAGQPATKKQPSWAGVKASVKSLSLSNSKSKNKVLSPRNTTREDRAKQYLNEIEDVYARRNPDRVKVGKAKQVRVRRHPRKSIHGPPSTPRAVMNPSKSHKNLGEDSSSSDEEWTHVPYSNLRDYMAQGGDEGRKSVGDYVDLAIIADPKEPGIKTWVETYTLRLYLYWIILITLACLLAALTMYMFIFLKKVYSQAVLLDLFWMSNYANVLAVVLCTIFMAFLGIFFLCYPSPQIWMSMKTTRWVMIIMPQIVLLVAHVDHIRLISKMPEIELTLQRAMESDLDFNNSGSILTDATQAYFQCCGVESYKDWEKVENFVYEGYPQSCCNGLYFMGCEIPMVSKNLHLRIPPLTSVEVTEGPRSQIFEDGCFSKEKMMLRALVGLVIGMTILISYSSIVATLLMWNVINHTNIHSVVTNHPFVE